VLIRSFSVVYGLLGIFFFFQAEDGIRDFHVTGVQTCALPIYRERRNRSVQPCARRRRTEARASRPDAGCAARLWGAAVCRVILQIGRASCRERVEISVASFLFI